MKVFDMGKNTSELWPFQQRVFDAAMNEVVAKAFPPDWVAAEIALLLLRAFFVDNPPPQNHRYDFPKR